MARKLVIMRLVKPYVRSLRAYAAKAPSGVRVKLDANEGPCGYSLSRRAIASNLNLTLSAPQNRGQGEWSVGVY